MAQKIIAKYLLAAHLAFMAVAPLFLFQFCSVTVIGHTLIWLSGLALIWVFMEPSIRSMENLHLARHRVKKAIVHDPLTWVLLAMTIFALVRYLNTGIRMAYDAEVQHWRLSEAALSLFPGCVADTGYLPFAAVVAASVGIIGARHGMGKLARVIFFFISSTLSGVAALLAIYLHATIELASYSYVGMAFGINLLFAIAALIAAFERKWSRIMPFFPLAIGGNAAGLFVCASAMESYVMFIVALVMLGYAFFYALKVLKGSGDFRFLVGFFLSLTVGALAVWMLHPAQATSAIFDAWLKRTFFTGEFTAMAPILKRIALDSWLGHIWIGTGIGSFGFDIRFMATAADWKVLAFDVVAVPCAWLQVLAERGLIGALMIVIPFGFLVFTFIRRMIVCIKARALPPPSVLVAPLAICGVAITLFFDNSLLRAEVLIALGVALAISAKSFPKRRD